MPWYIDSVLNRFKDEFYLKIKYVSEADLAVRELLTEYPLFLSDISSLKKEGGILEKTGKHNVLILGSHKAVVPALVKSVLQVGGYLRDDIIGSNEYLEKAVDHEYEDFEKCIGRYLSVSVIDERAAEIERILAYDAPDILKKELKYVHTVPAFYNYPVQTDDFLTLFSAAYSIDQTQNQDDDTMKQMTAVVAEANYIVVAMDDTEEAMKLAMRIRSMKYRYNVKDEPVISVYTPDRNEDEKIDQFTVGQNIYKDAFNRSYRVNMFGKYQKIYSKENLYDNLLDLISVELHIGDDSKAVEKKKRDYYNGAYNHMSCDCRSLAFIYAMYSVLGTKMIADFSLDDAEDVSAKLKVYNHWSMKLFQKNMDKYLQKYNEIIRKEGYKDALAVLEHHRWNYMLLCNGYVGYIDLAGQADQSVKKTIIEWCRQMVDNKKEIPIMIDYAHSPESLQNILSAVKSYTRGKVISVFGCGGDRDKGKRPIMGEISGRIADFTFITSDNPRTEKPEEIVKEIEDGIKKTKGNYKVVVDRTEAIKEAIKMATKLDIIVLAGKGHEPYQEINGEKYPYDERIIVKEIMENK